MCRRQYPWLSTPFLMGRRTNPAQQDVAVEPSQVCLALPRRALQSHPTRLVHDGKDASAAASKAVAGDAVDVQALKARRRVVGSDVIRRGLRRVLVENVVGQTDRQIPIHIGVPYGNEHGLQRTTETRRWALTPGTSGGRTKKTSWSTRSRPCGKVAAEQGPMARII